MIAKKLPSLLNKARTISSTDNTMNYLNHKSFENFDFALGSETSNFNNYLRKFGTKTTLNDIKKNKNEEK